jgi:hypothetical protein
MAGTTPLTDAAEKEAATDESGCGTCAASNYAA